MLTSLIKHERLLTTTPRARALAPLADKLITYAKGGTQHHRNLASRVVREKPQVIKLFGILAPRYERREGGYTRVMKVSCEDTVCVCNEGCVNSPAWRLTPRLIPF